MRGGVRCLERLNRQGKSRLGVHQYLANSDSILARKLRKLIRGYWLRVEACQGWWNALVAYYAIPVTPPDDIQQLAAIRTLSRGDDLEGDSPYEPCGFDSAPGLVQIQRSGSEE